MARLLKDQLISFPEFYTQEEIKSALSSLQEKKETLDKMKKNCEDTAAYIQV